MGLRQWDFIKTEELAASRGRRSRREKKVGVGEGKGEERNQLGRRDGLRKKSGQLEPKLSRETTLQFPFLLQVHRPPRLLFSPIFLAIFLWIAMEEYARDFYRDDVPQNNSFIVSQI